MSQFHLCPWPANTRIGFFFLVLHCTPNSTLFPYTTLFRSPARHGKYESTDRSHARGPELRRDGDDWLRRSEEHTSELQSRPHLVCRLLLEKKKEDLAQSLYDAGYFKVRLRYQHGFTFLANY